MTQVFDGAMGLLREMTPAEEAEYIETVALMAQQQVLPPISRFQFYKQCWLMEVITDTEASAAIAKQALPAKISTAIDAIQDKDQREEARMDALGLDWFRRDASLTETVRVANNWTPEQVDQIWIDGAKL